jgi:hypothetical protein
MANDNIPDSVAKGYGAKNRRGRRQQPRPNRSKRPRAAVDWREQLHAMAIEHGAIFDAELVRRSDPPRLETIVPLAKWLARLSSGQNSPLICLLCPSRFAAPAAMPEAMLIVTNCGEGSQTSFVSGICARCSAQPGEAILEAAREALGAALGAGLRDLPLANVHSHGGRA